MSSHMRHRASAVILILLFSGSTTYTSFLDGCSAFLQKNKKAIFIGSVVTLAGFLALRHFFKDNEKVKLCKNPFEEQRKKYYATLLIKPWGEIAKKYIEQLEKEERALMTELFRSTNTTEQQWQQFEQAYEYKNIFGHLPFIGAPFPARVEVQIAVRKIFEEAGLDLKKFRIHGTSLPSAISYSGNMLSVEHDLNPSTNLFKATIWHEIQHLFHNDEHRIYCIHDFIQQKSKNNKELEEIGLKLQRFAEKRADILANLLDPSYAKDDAEHYANFAEFDLKVQTHPTNLCRSQYLQNLYNDMLKAKNAR